MSTRRVQGAARVAAQAKLNLLLRIGEREATGFHQISTVFQRIALADAVTVRTTVRGRTLDTRGAEVGPVEQNLAWRAALAFAAVAGWPDGFAIEIEKRIPVGGGLGGGSADAGAVLRALNALAPRALGADSLAGIAFALGADVPYLASALPLALGTGRGERLLALEPLACRAVILLVPPFGVSSKDAFAWHDATRDGLARIPRATLHLPSPLTWSRVARCAGNDLEAPVFARHPELPTLRAALEHSGACIARMTGSGSTVFGVYDPPAAAAHDPRGSFTRHDATSITTTTVERVAEVELL